jgi:hypothetical protein
MREADLDNHMENENAEIENVSPANKEENKGEAGKNKDHPDTGQKRIMTPFIWNGLTRITR